jgi:Dipeptidyl peptidase IV (DPP IV) N-terminal region
MRQAARRADRSGDEKREQDRWWVRSWMERENRKRRGSRGMVLYIISARQPDSVGTSYISLRMALPQLRNLIHKDRTDQHAHHVRKAEVDRCPISVPRVNDYLLVLDFVFGRSSDSAASVRHGRIFSARFSEAGIPGQIFGPIRWTNGGESFTALEPSPSSPGANDVVRYDTATNKREVLLSASELKPSGSNAPLNVENCDWTEDMNQALIYTNSQKVWRANTRGDYWVLDRRSKSLRKLGGDPGPATLMFAKLSPDGSRVGYVRGNNIYVESAQTGAITQITHDGSATIINGTSDWVYEEEFGVRDAFRWSPDGKTIAYWQFNTAAVKNFALVYNVGAPYQVVTHIPYPDYGLYPLVKNIPYPQPGTANSAVRVGVVSSSGGETKWMQVPGDPSDTYIARMEWRETRTHWCCNI